MPRSSTSASRRDKGWFEAECERRAADSAEVLQTAIEVSDPGGYWVSVQTNLAPDRIRWVVVGDEIAPELRSIVELMNWQMSETEVACTWCRSRRCAAGWSARGACHGDNAAVNRFRRRAVPG
jgi:hypothetical protein